MTTDEQLTAKVMSDQTVQPCTIRIRDAWIIIAALQLAERHPGLGTAFKKLLKQIGQQLTTIVTTPHPEAKSLIDMGWNAKLDVDRNGKPVQQVTNCWTIYAPEDKEKTALAEFGRPQDWGDPRWMYRKYVLSTDAFINEVHCWIDRQIKEYEHLETFAPLIAQILLPGLQPEICGRDFLAEDDFWLEEWGKQPPYFDDGDEDEEEYG